jgi:hypothetical protein
MRMTRAMRQLWDEREKFLKSERGWEDDDEEEIDELDLDQLLERKLMLDENDKPKHIHNEVDYGPYADIDIEVKRKLGLVEELYVSSPLCVIESLFTVYRNEYCQIFSHWS